MFMKQIVVLHYLLFFVSFYIVSQSYEKIIVYEKSSYCVDKNILGIEKYFAGYGISIAQIKQETKNYLEKDRNNRNVQSIADTKDQLESIVVAGSPKNNPEDDDHDDESEDLSGMVEISKMMRPICLQIDPGI
jgi:hypothetical protein